MPLHQAIFHADLSDTRRDVHTFFAAQGRLHPLVAHDTASRARARAEAPHLAAVPDDRLTHYTAEPVHLPSEVALRVHLAYREADGRRPESGPHVGHAAIYVPPSAGELAAAEGAASHQHVDWISTAKALLCHHSDLRVQDAAVAAIVAEHLDRDRARATYALIEKLAMDMRRLGEPTTGAGGWALLDPVQYAGATHYLHQPRPEILVSARPALRALMLSTKNDLRLAGKKWQQVAGTSTQPMTPHRVGTLGADGSWSASVSDPSYVAGVKTTVSVDDAAKRIARVQMENIYVRSLAAYVQFLDADGRPLATPDWQPEGGLPSWLSLLESEWKKNDPHAQVLQEKDFRFLGTIDPIDTILAVPDPLIPGRLTGNEDGFGVRVRFPEGAVAANVYACGLGTGELPHPGACVYGSMMTVLLGFFVPAILMAFDIASKKSKPLYDFVQKVLSKTAVKVVGAIVLLVSKLGLFTVSAVQQHPDFGKLVSLAKVIFGKGFEWLLGWIEGQLGEDAAEKVAEEIPFAGWIASAVAILSDLALIAETVVEVLASPFQAGTAVHTEITSRVELSPDPRRGAFPPTAPGEKASYKVSLVHKHGGPTTVSVHDVPDDRRPQLGFEFRNRLGGEIKLEASYLVAGEVRGQATTGWLKNDLEHARLLPLVLVDKPDPLSAETVYRHARRFGYTDGAYGWIESERAPDAVYRPDTRQSGNAISEWNGLALSQRRHRLGWAWKAAGTGLADCAGGGVQQRQLHALATTATPGPAGETALGACGFADRSNLVCDRFPPKFLMEDGKWKIGPDHRPVPDPQAPDLGDYWIDPRRSGVGLDRGGGYHLRRLGDDGRIDPGAAGHTSYGRFLYAPESLALHPAGYVVGLSRQFHKIQVARLVPAGAPDDAVPVARTYSGQGIDFDGSGGRAGLLVLPIAVACSDDGTLLILENLRSQAFTRARVQAFDAQGDPVSSFRDGRGKPSPFLELPARGRTYLDLAVAGGHEQTTLFVLYSEGDGQKAADYHVAVYRLAAGAAAAKPLLTTGAFPAARIQADLWNTLYALDYAMTADAAGQPAGAPGNGTGPAGRTVPALSMWLPRTTGKGA